MASGQHPGNGVRRPRVTGVVSNGRRRCHVDAGVGAGAPLFRDSRHLAAQRAHPGSDQCGMGHGGKRRERGGDRDAAVSPVGSDGEWAVGADRTADLDAGGAARRSSICRGVPGLVALDRTAALPDSQCGANMGGDAASAAAGGQHPKRPGELLCGLCRSPHGLCSSPKSERTGRAVGVCPRGLERLFAAPPRTLVMKDAAIPG